MQCAEEEKQATSRCDEEHTNRPPSNFKHKKYLVSKFEEAMMIEAKSSLSGHKKQEKVNSTFQGKPVATAAAQPPLPPNPPPPDTPPVTVHVKQEIVDHEYNTPGTAAASSGKELSHESQAASKTDHSEEKSKATMCRMFARGTCKKGNACIFKHEIILSQLPEVYTFCRNFQNTVCSFPKCKFVHATVFEKEHFFRTGYLPPHCLSHIKEATVVQQPPQSHLPPQPKQEEALPERLRQYSNAEPSPPMPCGSSAMVPYNPLAAFQQNDPNMYALQCARSPPKRDWREIVEASNTTRVLDPGEPLAKKCKNCDNNEIREQLIRAKVERATRANKELRQKIANLERKNSLRAALNRVFQRPASSPNSSNNGLQFAAEQEIYGLLRNNNNWKSALSIMLRRVEAILPPETS